MSRDLLIIEINGIMLILMIMKAMGLKRECIIKGSKED